MKESEFDKFADEYGQIHKKNIKMSGEDPAYFAEYKVRDAAQEIRTAGFSDDLRLLDFGSGIGGSIPFFKQFLPKLQLTCLDVSKRSLEIAEERFRGEADFALFDGDQIPFPDAHFAAAFSACVFHHIDHGEHLSLFQEIFRTTADGGILVVFEHNPNNPLTVHAVNSCPFDENANLIPAIQLSKVIAAAGFEEVSVKYRVFFPRWLSALREVERFLTRIPFGAQYYVAARKPV